MITLSPKAFIWGVAAVSAIAVCSVWPPFIVVSLRAVREAEAKVAFNPKDFAQAIWEDELPSFAETAANIVDVARALNQDPAGAIEQYGKAWGLGGSTYFMLQGEGRIAAIHGDKLEVMIDGMPPSTAVTLMTDRIFGDTVRNASGLVDPSDFPNSQDLNNVSIALNEIVMREVLPPLRTSAKVNAHVRFVGCIEVRSAESISEIVIVPIAAGVIRDEE